MAAGVKPKAPATKGKDEPPPYDADEFMEILEVTSHLPTFHGRPESSLEWLLTPCLLSRIPLPLARSRGVTFSRITCGLTWQISFADLLIYLLYFILP